MPATFPPHRTRLHLLAALVSLLLSTTAWGGTSLLEQYHQLRSGASTTLPGTTLNLVSSVEGEQLSAEVYSLLHYPFDAVVSALAAHENWCQFMPLHFNIKACTYQRGGADEVLTLYSGRKLYQAPAESYQMDYRVETLQQDATHLSMRLLADRGPANTRDYQIALEVLRVEEGSMLHIRSAYRPSLLSRILTRGYLSTIGHDKVGFSRTLEGGELRLVQGIRGVIERNVIRYHLAIDAFLNTRELPLATRHEVALENWFQQNESYPQQLHEMTQADYLRIKRQEWRNQQQLQQELDEQMQLAVASQAEG